jgi:DNA-binding transcriptional LysR family regulator
MELRHLRYFVAVAEELHFGRAASRLSISQPPLSMSMRQLEEELGAKLLERDSKHVALTPAGAVFLEDVRRLLGQLGDATDLARRVASGATGRLRIGLTASMLYRGLPDLVKAYRSAYPKVVLTLVELNSAEQIEALSDDRIELGFVNVPQVPDGLEGLLVADEPFVACLPVGHRHAGSRRLDLGALADEPFVLFARSASPLYYERIIALCITAGFRPRVLFEARHWLSVAALVAKRMGVAVVPQAIRASGMHGTRFVPLRPSTILSSSWCVWNPAVKSPPRARFIEIYKSAFRQPR